MAITLYRDDGDLFKAKVAVEGASLANSKARLVLDFQEGRAYLLRGDIQDDGTVEIIVPRFDEPDGAQGRATLEVIADGAYFAPWQGQFELKSRRSASVDDVRMQERQKAKVSVVSVFKAEDSHDDANDGAETASRYSDDATDKDKDTVEKILSRFNGDLNEELEVSDKVIAWVERVMADATSDEAVFVATELQRKLNK